MKFIWIGLVSMALQAKNPILITFDKTRKRAQLAAKILHQKFSIPKALIDVQSSYTPCQSDHERVIHLCFNNLGKMAIAKYDRDTVNESFRIFFE